MKKLRFFRLQHLIFLLLEVFTNLTLDNPIPIILLHSVLNTHLFCFESKWQKFWKLSAYFQHLVWHFDVSSVYQKVWQTRKKSLKCLTSFCSMSSWLEHIIENDHCSWSWWHQFKWFDGKNHNFNNFVHGWEDTHCPCFN